MDPYQLIRKYVPLLMKFFACLTHSAKHNLPKLGNVDNIKDLLPHQCTAYLAGYGLGHIHSIDERKRSIGREVGCPVPVV
jgi:hypothetical protein